MIQFGTLIPCDLSLLPRIKAELTGREMHIESYGLEHHPELRPDKWVILKDQMLQCKMPLSLPMITNTISFFSVFENVNYKR